MIIQCDKCRKRLKYNGSKRSITCPGCGKSLPTIRDDQEVVAVVVDSPTKKTSTVDNLNADIKSVDKLLQNMITQIGKMPRFPVILTGIWLAWFGFGVLLFLMGMINYFQNVGGGVLAEYNGAFYTYGEWFTLNMSNSIAISMVTAFPAFIVSAIVYFWCNSHRDRTK